MEPTIPLTRTDQPKPKPSDSQLGFGEIFTDHMFLMDGAVDQGWHNPRIVPYGPLSLDPSTAVFHYGQALFEGIKAYRSPQDKILLFRADKSAERLNRSAERLCVPPIDESFFMTALKSLIAVDREWVPQAPGTSLYIRPTVIAADPYLGVRPQQFSLWIEMDHLSMKTQVKRPRNPIKNMPTDMRLGD